MTTVAARRLAVVVAAAMFSPMSSSAQGMAFNPMPSGHELTACQSCPTMVVVPAGAFIMGGGRDRPHDNDELPNHPVSFNKPFAIGKYEVTFAQWDACVADNACKHNPSDMGWGRDDRPVVNVSWDDIQSYLAWLNITTGRDYRLPTESEWEYAARAGSPVKYLFGDREEVLCSYANVADLRFQVATSATFVVHCNDRHDVTAPVGSYAANAWGLHDMHGNAAEWVKDCWNDNYVDASRNGKAWLFPVGNVCDYRVIRGGAWNSPPEDVRSANRNYLKRDSRVSSVGFRLAQDIY